MRARVFLFGQTGAGKSTVAASICYYCHETKGLTPRLNISNEGGVRKAIQWVKSLRNGRFPEKSSVGAFYRVDVGFEDRRTGQVAALQFFEMAGEDVIMLDPLHDRHSERAKRVDEWLASANVLVLVASSVPRPDDRFVLQTFMEYVLQHRHDLPTVLVVSGWDLVPAPTRRLQEFVEKEYSEVGRLLASVHAKGVRTDIMPFSIGDVSEDGQIISVNLDSGASELVRWILTCCEEGEHYER